MDIYVWKERGFGWLGGCGRVLGWSECIVEYWCTVGWWECWVEGGVVCGG